MFFSKQTTRQILAICPVFFDQFSIGLTYGWVSPILNQLRDPSRRFRMTEEECSWIASLHNVGRALGPIVGGLLVDKIGRKYLLVSCSVTFFLTWLVVLFTRNFWSLCAVRLIVGLGVGVHDSTAFIYIAENSSPHVRGTFSSVTLSFFNLGELVSFALATYLTYDQVAVVQAATTFVFLSFVFWLREPVQFLLMKGKYEQAEKNFYRLNPKTEQSKLQLEEIVANVRQEQEKVSWKQLINTKANYLSLKVVLVISVLEMFTGFEAIIAFVSMAFSSSQTLNEYEFTILFGLFQYIAVCMSSCIIDRFNRRTLIMLCFAGSGIAHAITTALYYVDQSIVPIPYFPWLIFLSITSYAVIYSIGIMPIYFTVKGELFPQSIKGMGNCMSEVVNSAVAFATAKVFLWICSHFGIHCNFLLYSVVSFIALTYVYFTLPETKGKTLVEIQKSLENKN